MFVGQPAIHYKVCKSEIADMQGYDQTPSTFILHLNHSQNSAVNAQQQWLSAVRHCQSQGHTLTKFVAQLCKCIIHPDKLIEAHISVM